jgi:hypothetical protein
MRWPFIKTMIGAIFGAVLVSSFVAGGVSAITSGNSHESAVAVAVNRANKGDRLTPTVWFQRSQLDTMSTRAKVEPKRVPLGCEPAFSPVADPARAHIYKRCVT